MTSEPPVEPPADNPKPTLVPKNTAPTIHAMNFWSASICKSGGIMLCSIVEASVKTTTPYMVLAQKRHPSTFNATISSTALSAKKVSCTGMPVPQYTIEATPMMPPVVISWGSRNRLRPTTPNNIAMVMMP